MTDEQKAEARERYEVAHAKALKSRFKVVSANK
jgi:hypothetical protein